MIGSRANVVQKGTFAKTHNCLLTTNIYFVAPYLKQVIFAFAYHGIFSIWWVCIHYYLT